MQNYWRIYDNYIICSTFFIICWGGAKIFVNETNFVITVSCVGLRQSERKICRKKKTWNRALVERARTQDHRVGKWKEGRRPASEWPCVFNFAQFFIRWGARCQLVVGWTFWGKYEPSCDKNMLWGWITSTVGIIIEIDRGGDDSRARFSPSARGGFRSFVITSVLLKSSMCRVLSRGRFQRRKTNSEKKTLIIIKKWCDEWIYSFAFPSPCCVSVRPEADFWFAYIFKWAENRFHTLVRIKRSDVSLKIGAWQTTKIMKLCFRPNYRYMR